MALVKTLCAHRGLKNTTMENTTKEVITTVENATNNDQITRKEALVKAGKYAAFTALGMMVLLSPKQSQAQSSLPGGPGGGPFGL